MWTVYGCTSLTNVTTPNSVTSIGESVFSSCFNLNSAIIGNSVFALDVFDGHHGFWQTAFALAMHLIPTAIVLLFLLLAWRWEWTGAVFFTALAVLYLVAFPGRVHWSAYALISGPLFLLGMLFLLNWVFRAELRPNPPRLTTPSVSG